MAKEKRAIVLYPVYFDAERSRDDGRRVSRKIALRAPTVEEIAAAAGTLGLKPKVEAESAHPSTPWKRDGRVLVRADYFKTSVVRKIAEKMKEARGAQAK